ncbi:PadR family transcriptional regulator [Bifidobacterium longum subsp. infantis]|uniref:PadR family transcriptional regulator n=1 Tax=Bifidobacterium longum subsp. infantis TaxID=1682 RepID=A0A7D4XY28_BIFLI|nr:MULTISPECIES: PadR family transcriptional regulator [Bifidobacterium]KAB1945877.1 PadR family transcriptional regulator [Bifidobacterium longum subsp. infantis]KEY29395.1 PadR family transcriptional regulator [Bifidobacterium longum subsp. infantis EK3]MED7618871.1 PadR family transcriptional regulator [Bifidobacterium longum subsp. infantis]NQX51036.1 PadR family transcriptional regulator [Bifidobacterium longum subsp. infantis]QKY13768.1 PadR family transcriptional regulator [Bifidobacter
MSLIEMMILGFLSERSMCGYELRKKMEQLQGYARKFSDGTVYPATNRLVEAVLISEQSEIRDGRQRRVFTLLEAGRNKLIEELRNTGGFNLTDITRWTVVLTFLGVVPDKSDRDAVLRRRYDLLNGHDVHFFYCDAGNPLSIEQIDDPYRRGIIAVHDAEIAAELDWLRSMLGIEDESVAQ